MEAPRLAPTMSGPGSPCEEVLKNLSLEAIQLCERDGKAAPRRAALCPPPARTKGGGRAGQHRGQRRAARGGQRGFPAGGQPPLACRDTAAPGSRPAQRTSGLRGRGVLRAGGGWQQVRLAGNGGPVRVRGTAALTQLLPRRGWISEPVMGGVCRNRQPASSAFFFFFPQISSDEILRSVDQDRLNLLNNEIL